MSLILFFTNVGPNLANDITEPDENISIYDYLGESIEQSLFMRPVDEEEVITTVTGQARIQLLAKGEVVKIMERKLLLP